MTYAEQNHKKQEAADSKKEAQLRYCAYSKPLRRNHGIRVNGRGCERAMTELTQKYKDRLQAAVEKQKGKK